MTTFSSDLANVLRSMADMLEAGGYVKIVLLVIAVVFGAWAAFDVWKYVVERREKPNDAAGSVTDKKVSAQDQPSMTEVVQQDPDAAKNVDLQKALKREAEAKARSVQVDSDFRTFIYDVNTALGTILTPKRWRSGSDNEDYNH